MRNPRFLFQLAAAFAVLTVVATTLSWQRAKAASADLEKDLVELTAPAQQKVVLDEPGAYEVVLLPKAAPTDDEEPPRMEEARRLRASLQSPAGGSATWTEAPGLGSLDDKDKDMAVTLGSFAVERPGPHLLSLSYEGEGPRVKAVFGRNAKARGESAARWAVSILLALFLGGCLTVGALLMGVVFSTKPREEEDE